MLTLRCRCQVLDFDPERKMREYQVELLMEQFVGPLITVTTDGTVVSWNRAAEKVFGFTAEEALNQSFANLLVPAERLSEARRWFALALQRVLQPTTPLKRPRTIT